jgi:hypothetical protein
MGNSRTATQNPELVWKLMSKEDKRSISLLFPRTLLEFLPHLWMIVLGIAIIEGKKDRIYRDCSKKADNITSRPANSIAKAENEPLITYGTAQLEFLEYLWRTRATFPLIRIILWGDDEASCFNQKQMHPSLTSSMMTVFKDIICFAVGNHFGGNWGPADNEPVARAKERLCEYMYHHTHFQQELNLDLTEKVKMVLPTLTEPLAQAKVESRAHLQQREDGSHKLVYKMYVDDSQTATLASEDNARQMITTSTEATYLLRGFPGRIHQPFITPTMAYDKVEFVVEPTAMFLGIEIDADRLIVKIPLKKLIRLRDILRRHWNRKRKNFIVRHAAQLVGNLLWCLRGNWWLMSLCFSFTSMIKTALARNGARLIRTKHWEAILSEASEQWLEPTAGGNDAKMLGLRSRYSRALWASKDKTWTPAAVHDHAEWLEQALTEAIEGRDTSWYKPISHIVRRNADYQLYFDASSGEGAGGHSPDLRFWFQCFWDSFGPEFATWIKKTLNEGKTTDAHINWLEYIASILNTAAAIVTYQYRGVHLPWPPMLEHNGDNNTANKAVGKGTARTSSQVAGALARVQSNLLKISGFGNKSDRVSTYDNKLADGLTRKTTKQLAIDYFLLAPHERRLFLDPLQKSYTDTESTTSYVRFLPSKELLLAISSAALRPQETGFSMIENVRSLGRVLPDNSIFSDSVI